MELELQVLGLILPTTVALLCIEWNTETQSHKYFRLPCTSNVAMKKNLIIQHKLLFDPQA